MNHFIRVGKHTFNTGSISTIIHTKNRVTIFVTGDEEAFVLIGEYAEKFNKYMESITQVL